MEEGAVMKLFAKRFAERKHKKELKRKEKKQKIKKYNLLMGIVMSERPTFRPNAIQRTQKESILSIYKKMHIRLKSKQNTVEGYVK
jgi:hypothetical protein